MALGEGVDGGGDGAELFVAAGADDGAVAQGGGERPSTRFGEHVVKQAGAQVETEPVHEQPLRIEDVDDRGEGDAQVLNQRNEFGGDVDRPRFHGLPQPVHGERLGREQLGLGGGEALGDDGEERGIGRFGFEAAVVPAAAATTIEADGDVSDFPGEATVPFEEMPSFDNAQAHPFADIENGEVAFAACFAIELFGEAQPVTLLQDGDIEQTIEGGAEIVAHELAIGLGDVGRGDRAFGAGIEEAGEADADAEDVGFEGGLPGADRFGDRFDEVAVVGWGGDGVEAVEVELAFEVGADHFADAGTDDDADERDARASEADDFARTADEALFDFFFLDEPGFEEGEDGAGDGGAADAGEAGEVGAGERSPGLQLAKDRLLVEAAEQRGTGVGGERQHGQRAMRSRVGTAHQGSPVCNPRTASPRLQRTSTAGHGWGSLAPVGDPVGVWRPCW